LFSLGAPHCHEEIFSNFFRLNGEGQVKNEKELITKRQDFIAKQYFNELCYIKT